MKHEKMRQSLLILLLGCFGLSLQATIQIDRIDPAFWWTGMKNSKLQIMVYGPDIAQASVSIDYPGVTLTDAVKLESPNYLFLYLDINPKTQPGSFDILFSRGKETFKQKYELKMREKERAERKGFSSEDVLYLIMPDRFADGDPSNNSISSMKFPVNVNRNNPNARHGGDLKGIEQHLDYIQELGVTAVWLNPVLENDMPGGSYHGYATTDYYKVDSRFGTNQDYK